jgi:subtilisin family serine protease
VPATYEEVITVSAFAHVDGEAGGEGISTCTRDGDETFARFRNIGLDVDIAAPGVCILSAWPNGKCLSLSGTSMATPHVTGATARSITQNPNATVAEVKGWAGEGVLGGLASRPSSPASPYGFTGDPDAFDEGVLYLGTA